MLVARRVPTVALVRTARFCGARLGVARVPCVGDRLLHRSDGLRDLLCGARGRGDRVTPAEKAGEHRDDEQKSRCQWRSGRAIHVAFMLRGAGRDARSHRWRAPWGS